MHKKLLTVTFESRTLKFSTKKTVNPNTRKSSGTENEFSAQNWNARTLCHLKDIKALGEKRYNEVFDMANNSRCGRTRANCEPTSDHDGIYSDYSLRSEDSNDGEEKTHIETHIEDGNFQGYEDSKFSFKSVNIKMLIF